MKNNIYRLADGKEYVVITEEVIDGVRYVLVSECNFERDEMNETELHLKTVVTNEKGTFFNNVDKHIGIEIVPKMLKKYEGVVEYL